MAKTPRLIVTRYSTIDRFYERRTFKTLEGARAYAQRRMGDSFDIGGSYAVSFDGVGKLTVTGATLEELLTKTTVEAV